MALMELMYRLALTSAPAPVLPMSWLALMLLVVATSEGSVVVPRTDTEPPDTTVVLPSANVN